MAEFMKRLVSGVLDLALPRHCAVTGVPLDADHRFPISPEVARAVQVFRNDYCTRCGAPQGEGVGQIAGCLACKPVRGGFAASEIVAIGEYSDELVELCLALKFGGERKVAQVLAAWLAALVTDRGVTEHVELVVPVPLSALRRLRRGYNQSEEIARELASLLKLPWRNALRRVRDTPRQAMLSPAQRRANVADAFIARPNADIKGRGVLLVDDVMTTGATFTAAARALKRGGAKPVFGAIAARSVGK